MKKAFYISLATVLFFASCNSEKTSKSTVDTVTKNEIKTDTPAEDEVPLVGADKDEHGCIGSAGYTYSKIKKDCVRVWETGIQLEQLDKNAEAIFSATIIPADDESKVELFAVGEKESLILNKDAASKETTYTANNYVLTKTGENWSLSKDGKKLYSK
jgi:hypothetical protein